MPRIRLEYQAQTTDSGIVGGDLEIDVFGALAHRIVAFLDRRIQASRSEIMVECFQGHASKANIDAAIERLLNTSPPRISMHLIHRPKEKPGSPTTIYKLIETRAGAGQKVL